MVDVRIRALAVDIDGTLTIDRGVFTLDLEAIEMLRRVAAQGVHVMLVTGNSVPVVAGLARYLGFEKSPHVAENGCLVFYRGARRRVCEGDARQAAMLVEEHLSDILYPSWQNVYRHCDYAYNLRSGVDPQEAKRRVEKLLQEHGIRGVKVGYSGYAIHLRPECVSKARGVLEALRLAGVAPQETIAVGDSAIDAELREAAALLVAVGNADEELKKAADIVLPGRSAESVKHLIRAMLESGLVVEKLVEVVSGKG